MRLASLAASALLPLAAFVMPGAAAAQTANPAPPAAATQAARPNIVVIWGDDVGMWNIGAYHRGLMCERTPNIDRIASEGMLFLTHYAQASCTAGRAAFITGQHPLRVGLSTVGLPGAPQGLQKEDPTIAELLKPLGYRTAQFGKNHLGDRDDHLPTAHGFDEFEGILYHLNAGEYVEQDFFPKDPTVAKAFAQRGIVRSKALPGGRQQIEDLGNFGRERQRTMDSDTAANSVRFIKESAASGKPYFLWHNSSRMHYRTNLSPEFAGKTGCGVYADGMLELDTHVGQILKAIDETGGAGNTVVIFSTDNGAATNSWPDGGNQPFRGEKGVGGYEGGYRVPAMIRWPGVVKPGSTSAGIIAMEDWMPTFMAYLGQPDLKTELLTGKSIGGRRYKVHLDGYNQLPMLQGTGPSNRKEYFYFTETNFHGVRVGDWKFLFTQQDRWFNGVVDKLTTPLITNLALDPFERMHEGRGFDEWQENLSWTIMPAMAAAQTFADSFKAFPPRQQSLEVDTSEMFRKALSTPPAK
jgi:arylsulfatase